MTVVVVVGGALLKAELARHSTDLAGQPLSPTRCVTSGRKNFCRGAGVQTHHVHALCKRSDRWGERLLCP